MPQVLRCWIVILPHRLHLHHRHQFRASWVTRLCLVRLGAVPSHGYESKCCYVFGAHDSCYRPCKQLLKPSLAQVSLWWLLRPVLCALTQVTLLGLTAVTLTMWTSTRTTGSCASTCPTATRRRRCGRPSMGAGIAWGLPCNVLVTDTVWVRALVQPLRGLQHDTMTLGLQAVPVCLRLKLRQHRGHQLANWLLHAQRGRRLRIAAGRASILLRTNDFADRLRTLPLRRWGSTTFRRLLLVHEVMLCSPIMQLRRGGHVPSRTSWVSESVA